MDLLADELVARATGRPGLEIARIRPPMLAPFKKLARSAATSGFVHNLDRVSGRYLEYSLRILAERGRFDRYHLVDHSYAHLALFLPGERTGVFCHDIDVFRPLFESGAERWRRALARTLLSGLRRANVVFYSTPLVRAEILERRLVSPERLVQAPYGVAAEFRPEPGPEDEAARARPPYLLHVGSLIPRKNPEFLLRIFAAIGRARPELEFLQVGGEYEAPALAAAYPARARTAVSKRARRADAESRGGLRPAGHRGALVRSPGGGERHPGVSAGGRRRRELLPHERARSVAGSRARSLGQ
jgi:glycosyltransferase involved in cell wall biosynthesis